MKIQFPLFSPDDAPGTGVIDAPKKEVFDDDTTLLDNLLDKPKSKDDEDEDDDEDEKEADKDLIEDDEELDESPEDEEVVDDDVKGDELIDTNIRAVDFKRIKEKYGDFAKTNEFRELKNAYYREGKLTEIFPTIEDAQEASENNETFTKLNDAIVNHADATVLLTAIKEANPESVEKFSVNFLDNLSKFDNQLYIKAITPVVKKLARQINIDGKKILARNAQSEDGIALVATARNIMMHFFDDADLVDKDEPQEDPRIAAKEKEISERERNIAQEKHNTAWGAVAGAVDRHLTKAITDGLDPDNRMNEFTRDTLVEKIKNAVGGQLESDRSHMRRMKSLWNRATNDGYNRESLSRIVAAYLERARPIISSSRAKYKSIALKGSSRKEEDNSGGKEPVRISSKGQSGKSPSRDGKVNLKAVDTKKIDYRNTSDDDIFEGRVKIKG